MSALSLRDVARGTNGKVVGHQVLAAGPGHRPGDESLSITLSPQSPNGILVHSFAGDDWKVCRDYVAAKLGLGSDAWRRPASLAPRPSQPRSVSTTTDEADRRKRIVRAVEIWAEAKDPRGTIVERYLASRGLSLPEGSDAIRFHSRCPWRDEAESRTVFVPCMVAAMRTINGDAIHAVHRTRLNEAGEKVDRRMLGIAANTAIKIDGDDAVEQGITIAEGLETAMTGRLFGLKPAWAVGSAGAIASFPILPGVSGITILGETGKANEEAVRVCGRRWLEQGREVIVVDPVSGSDLNDALRGVE